MNLPLAAAIEHIRVMEARIAQQETAVHELKQAGRDISDAASRLQLLHVTLDEMRIQLARLIPTEEQVAAPMWALPLPNANDDRRTA